LSRLTESDLAPCGSPGVARDYLAIIVTVDEVDELDALLAR
jgi:hypothetical protein